MRKHFRKLKGRYLVNRRKGDGLESGTGWEYGVGGKR